MTVNDRVDIQFITKEWVQDNCKSITNRDMELLRLLRDKRILRRDQIELLLSEENKFASTDRLNKRLRALYNLHIIDRVYPKVGVGMGSSKQHVCLDRAGAILLGMQNYNRAVKVDSSGNKSLPFGWQHRVMINDFECTIKSCSDRVLYYGSEEPIRFNGTKLVPDATTLLVNKGKGYVFMFELDMGTEDIKTLKKKIDKYIDYYLSKVWESAEWNKPFKTPVFPRVIISLPELSGKRHNAVKEYCEDKSIRFMLTGHSDVYQSIIDIIGV